MAQQTANKPSSGKLYLQQNSFSGGINTTEENVNLRDDEVRDIVNMTLTEGGSVSRRLGSQVVADIGTVLKNEKHWYLKSDEKPDGIFAADNEEEYKAFLSANKVLGHFTYQSGGSTRHYLVTKLGIFDEEANELQLYRYDGRNDSVEKTPTPIVDIPKDFGWDMIINPGESGYWAEYMDVVLDENGVEQYEPLGGDNPTKFWIDQLGRIGKNKDNLQDVDPDNDAYWPVDAKGNIPVRWLGEDRNNVWDWTNPGTYAPKKPDATEPIEGWDTINFQTLITNISNGVTSSKGTDADGNEENHLIPYFYLGGSLPRQAYVESFGYKNTLAFARGVKFTDMWFRQQSGLALGDEWRNVPWENTETKDIVVSSVQYETTTYLIINGEIYTFEGGTKITEKPWYKPTFEQYNNLGTNLLAQPLSPQTNAEQPYDVYKNWDWYAKPDNENMPSIPVVLGVMQNGIPEINKPMSMRAIATIAKKYNASTNQWEADTTTSWKFYWKYITETGDESSGSGAAVPLQQFPRETPEYYGFPVPATQTGTLQLIAVIDSGTTPVKLDGDTTNFGLEYNQENSTLAFVYKEFHSLGTMARGREYAMGRAAPGEPNYNLKDQNGWEWVSTLKGDHALKTDGSGVSMVMMRSAFKLPDKVVQTVLGTSEAAATFELGNLNFKVPSDAAKMIEAYIDANSMAFSSSCAKKYGTSGAYAYLSFGSNQVQRGVNKWDKLLKHFNETSGWRYTDDKQSITDNPICTHKHHTDNPNNTGTTDIGSIGSGGAFAYGKSGQSESNRRVENTYNDVPLSPHGAFALGQSSVFGGSIWASAFEAGEHAHWHNTNIVKWMKRYWHSPIPGGKYYSLGYTDIVNSGGDWKLDKMYPLNGKLDTKKSNVLSPVTTDVANNSIIYTMTSDTQHIQITNADLFKYIDPDGVMKSYLTLQSTNEKVVQATMATDMNSFDVYLKGLGNASVIITNSLSNATLIINITVKDPEAAVMDAASDMDNSIRTDPIGAINFATDINNMKTLLLAADLSGLAPPADGDWSTYIAAPGVTTMQEDAWTAADLDGIDLYLNVVSYMTLVPWDTKTDTFNRNRYGSFWKGTYLKVASDTGVAEGDTAKYFTKSQITGSGYGTSKNQFKVQYPIKPIQDVATYLPTPKLLNTINSDKLNNGYIYNSQFFVWSLTDPIIFYSDIRNFGYFPLLQTIRLSDYPDEQVQAMQVFNGSCLIFTKNRIYRLDGSSIEDFETHLVNDAVGVINKDSIKAIGNNVYFVSRKGAYVLSPSQGVENQYSVWVIDTKVKDFYDPSTDTIQCTVDGENFLIHVLNKKITLVYDTINRVWTRNAYDLAADILYVKEMNQDTFYVTSDWKICRFLSNTDKLSTDISTGSYDILRLQSLYLDALDLPIVMPDGVPNVEEYPDCFTYSTDEPSLESITGFQLVWVDPNDDKIVPTQLGLEGRGFGYPITCRLDTKEYSGSGNYIHHLKKWKEQQVKFTRESYASGGWFYLKVDGNEIITPEYYESVNNSGEFSIVTEKIDYHLQPKDRSVLTRNAGMWLSRSAKLSSGVYINHLNDETWTEGSEASDGYDYQPPLSSKLQDTSETNLRKKKGKKGYTAQLTFLNDEPLPFGIKSIMMVYKLKKAK